MNTNTVIDQIRAEKIIAIVRGDYTLDAIRVMANALHESGVNILEVTMNSAGVLDAIKLLDAEFGDRMLIGAGTVLEPSQVSAAAAAGAKFIVSPETYEPVIKMAQGLGLEPMPGALTPTEIMTAARAGARLVKVFPAGPIGGPGYIKAIRAPLNQIALVVTGGVEIEDAREYILAGAVAVGMGGQLVPKQFDGSPEAAALLVARGQKLRGLIAGNQRLVSA